jgi:transcriptional regulator with XRE-family HTH domain
MKLGEVLKKERERKRLTAEDVAGQIGVPPEQYKEMEDGNSPAEEWGPRLAQIAIQLKTPTSRLIAETGKSAQAKQVEGQCGKLIKHHREKRDLTREALADKLKISLSDVGDIEEGSTPLENYAPLLLSFAEVIEQPIFNLFYPCGLPLDQLTDYP